ncbi:hypothetical protein Zm00014a_042758 [Zea mays]|uniref:Uncharacterized protein n=1 Tax=Zea mays TaxID=4577 RepID=A0A3L6G6B4_MAIZE|nr:hypothetical protein Zm00014a_042758 [Zea mays]
MGPKCERSIFI